jgi:hypothetical protein
MHFENALRLMFFQMNVKMRSKIKTESLGKIQFERGASKNRVLYTTGRAKTLSKILQLILALPLNFVAFWITVLPNAIYV